MPAVPSQYSRATMPHPGGYSSNPEMAAQISENPVFAAVANEVAHQRELQAQKWNYTYTLSGSIAGQATLPFTLTIEQGTDFICQWLTASAYSYDSENASTFPIPNSAGSTAWAGRGLSVNIVETRSGRELTSGFVALELLGTPGYGLNFQQPYPFKNFFWRNSKIRFDIRNRDSADRTHYFDIALNGYKVVTPQ